MPRITPDRIDVEAAKPVLRDLLQAGSRLYMHFARETLAASQRALIIRPCAARTALPAAGYGSPEDRPYT